MTAAEYFQTRAIADQAAQAAQAPAAGVVVSYERGEFVIWAMNREGRIYDHRLAADCTDLIRLTAHVEGFVANHRAMWA